MGTNISINSLNNQIIPSNKKKSDVNFNGFAGTGFTNFMEAYQGAGFVLPFVTQDILGSIGPRTHQGYNRNKEITGKHNPKEAIEVFLREVLTGPCMFLIPLASFGLFRKTLGNSSFQNTNEIKSFNGILENTVKNVSSHNELKAKFVHDTVEGALIDTIGTADGKSKIISSIGLIEEHQQKLKETPFTDFKARKEIKKQIKDIKKEIGEFVNSRIKENTSDFEKVGKLKVNGSEIKIDSFADNVIMYSNDVVEKVSKFASAVEKADLSAITKEVTNISLGRRSLANLATLGLTIAFVSIIPKLYAHNKTAPGLKGLVDDERLNKNNKNTSSKPTFTGRLSDFANKTSRVIGEKVSKVKGETFFKQFEFNEYNMTNAICALTCGGFVIPPRVLEAKKRAITNADGTKDNSEIKEIYYRDVPTIGSLIFGVPVLEKLGAKYFGKLSGSVLLTNAKSSVEGQEPTKFKRFIDMINPFGGRHVYKMKELNEIYGNITSEKQVDNLVAFIEKGKGDLLKMVRGLSDENRALFKTAKNKEDVIALMKNAFKSADENQMKKLLKSDAFAYAAKKYNGGVSAFSAFLILPIVLGLLIPRFTYKMTKDKFMKEKQAEQDKNKSQAANVMPAVQAAPSTSPYFQNSENMKKTFSSFLHTN